MLINILGGWCGLILVSPHIQATNKKLSGSVMICSLHTINTVLFCVLLQLRRLLWLFYSFCLKYGLIVYDNILFGMRIDPYSLNHHIT